MVGVNENFINLPQSYLFSEVARRISDFKYKNPEVEIIKMGIGDVTRPICKASIEAMHRAVDEMAQVATFHGYGPEQGYEFLRSKILEYDYQSRGIEIDISEIFVSDGAKSDLGNIGDIFSKDCKVAITDPVYPVYVDSNVMSGRAGSIVDGKWSRIIYLPCTAENDFIPGFPDERPDLIYLCYPNNPTGIALSRTQLKEWVDYAKQNHCVILFDSAYEAFIRDENIQHSIYEIEGAKDVAIEFRSFSKTAGFTGLRCGYTVVPHNLKAFDSSGNSFRLNPLWNRRQCTKFNGASYITQRAAEAIYTQQGQIQVREAIAYYLANADHLCLQLPKTGLTVYGGVNAPYIWVKAPQGMTSWQFFDILLRDYHIVGTPGVGFGSLGEGYLRLTAFNTAENTTKAIQALGNAVF